MAIEPNAQVLDTDNFFLIAILLEQSLFSWENWSFEVWYDTVSDSIDELASDLLVIDLDTVRTVNPKAPCPLYNTPTRAYLKDLAYNIEPVYAYRTVASYIHRNRKQLKNYRKPVASTESKNTYYLRILNQLAIDLATQIISKLPAWDECNDFI